MHESTSWTLHPQRFLQKAEAVRPILRSNTAIQVITGCPQISLRRWVRPAGALTARAHTDCECKAHHVRAKTRQKRVPRAAYPWGAACSDRACAKIKHDQPVGEDARDCRSLRGGSDQRRRSGYRESATQIMMSKVDRTNALYYVVNVSNTHSRSHSARCAPSAAQLLPVSRWMLSQGTRYV